MKTLQISLPCLVLMASSLGISSQNPLVTGSVPLMDLPQNYWAQNLPQLPIRSKPWVSQTGLMEVLSPSNSISDLTKTSVTCSHSTIQEIQWLMFLNSKLFRPTQTFTMFTPGVPLISLEVKNHSSVPSS